MDKAAIEAAVESALESLAELEHERWSRWQQYVHSKGILQSDGSLVIPTTHVERWARQFSTSYCDLTDSEKESDREQVRYYLPVLMKALGSQSEES